MAAAAIERGKNDGLFLLIKSFDQFSDQARTHQRMIDRTEYNPIGVDSFEIAQPRPYGRKLSPLPIRVQHHDRRIEFRDRTDHFRARTQHDARSADPRMASNFD